MTVGQSATTLTRNNQWEKDRPRGGVHKEYYGKESNGVREAADPRGQGESRPAGWYGARPAGHQHHGLLQRVQRSDAGPGYDSPGRDHDLLGQVLHLHYEDAARGDPSEEGSGNREGIGSTEPQQDREGHARAGPEDRRDQDA